MQLQYKSFKVNCCSYVRKIEPPDFFIERLVNFALLN